jgi:alpha-L-fucosidase
MGWRAGDVAIRALGLGSPQQPGKVAKVEMLGVKAPLKFTQTSAGLKVTFPPQKPGEIAYGLRVTPA